MKSSEARLSTRIKVGVFSLLFVVLVIAVTVWVNDRPYWYRPCQLVNISVEDATGLKKKSPIRSLGLEIGYLRAVELSETKVMLSICITAPVEVLTQTKAYIRGEGFLGDKFVELKPVRYTGEPTGIPSPSGVTPQPASESRVPSGARFPRGADSNVKFVPQARFLRGGRAAWVAGLLMALGAEAQAATDSQPKSGRQGRPSREIPVGEEGQDIQKLVTRVDELVHQMTGLTNNLKDAINPDELRRTMKELNRTLEAASKTLSPEGGLNSTAQRTLAKLEDSIEQLRAQLTRINKGEGSVGMLLNDPSYAEQIREAIKNVNRLLSRVGDVRFIIDLGGQYISNSSYDGGRAWFRLGIWPTLDRYYLVGLGVDPRGMVSQQTVTTTAGGTSTTASSLSTSTTSFVLTGMLGKVFWNRLDLSVGIYSGDGAGILRFRLGPTTREDMFTVEGQVYLRNAGSSSSVNGRALAFARPIPIAPLSAIYLAGGVEAIVPGSDGRIPFFGSAGLMFDDEDIRILFALR